MKLLILCCLVAATMAAPATSADTVVLKYDNDNIGTGPFRYAYEQSDGTKSEAQGTVINEGKEDAAVAIKGVFSFIIDGITYTVTYVADENGYQPNIEQGPGGAVPAAVVASLLGSG